MNATLYRFCKAYPSEQVLAYAPLMEHVSLQGKSLRDHPVIYLHHDLVLRSGMFDDDEVLYSDASAEWRDFCTRQLAFQDLNAPSST